MILRSLAMYSIGNINLQLKLPFPSSELINIKQDSN